MTKAKFNRDNPKLWKAMDAWAEARLFAALKGYFNLKEDDKVIAALNKGDVETIVKFTKKRFKAVGASKAKFKKQKKVGQAAMDEPGTRANALKIYNEKVFGKPKKVKKVTGKKKEKKEKKDKIEKTPHRNPSSSPDSGLPHIDAYQQARDKEKPGEILLHIIHRGENRFTAKYYNPKTKKRRSLHITGAYLEPLKLEWGKPRKVKKAVPKSEPKKSKKRQSRY